MRSSWLHGAVSSSASFSFFTHALIEPAHLHLKVTRDEVAIELTVDFTLSGFMKGMQVDLSLSVMMVPIETMLVGTFELLILNVKSRF